MTVELEFLFDNQLIAALESLIKSAKYKLFLVSPYIDLDERIIDALKEKIGKHDFELKILFGKNENNYEKSLKRDSLAFFKTFPNVEIRYNTRLHAKYYQNDYDFILTSLNLYDYSLANNIEVGIKVNHASKGLLGKANDEINSVFSKGVDKVKEDVLGINKSITPMEKFKTIFDLSDLIYKTEPKVSEKSGLQGFLGSKKLDGFNVIVNKLNTDISNQTRNTNLSKEKENNSNNPKSSSDGRSISASQLSKKCGVSVKDINFLMQKSGLINGDRITDLGQSKGLVIKSYMGNDYVAYPEDLAELKEFM